MVGTQRYEITKGTVADRALTGFAEATRLARWN
jgi:hypothetical protein